MRITVCVTRVADLTEATAFRTRGAGLPDEIQRRCLNPADVSALEEALRIKDRTSGTRVTVITLGPPECEALLRDCLAAGADVALLLWDSAFEGGDTLATARVLSRAVQELRTDLVLCGRQATDGATGQTPFQLGELLGLPVVSSVVHIEGLRGASDLLVHRKMERGYRAVIRCSLPAVLALEAGMSRLRYPRLRDRFRAQRALIERWDCRRLGLRPEEVGESGSCVQVLEVGPPKPDMRGLFVPESSLSGMERWEAVISGGLTGRAEAAAGETSRRVEGPPETLAERLLSFLAENGFA
jgi:electron transfer flavoprotein beta subunit